MRAAIYSIICSHAASAASDLDALPELCLYSYDWPTCPPDNVVNGRTADEYYAPALIGFATVSREPPFCAAD